MADEKQIVAVADESSPKWISLDGGTIVTGIHLVSDKLIGIINEIMKHDAYTDDDGAKHKSDNFGVRSITFKNNGKWHKSHIGQVNRCNQRDFEAGRV